MLWCTIDYLGMGQHPKVIGAMVETATHMGTWAGGTRNIAGTTHPLVELERELADLRGKDGALAFTSGYVSNEGGIATIARLIPNCLILSKKPSPILTRCMRSACTESAVAASPNAIASI